MKASSNSKKIKFSSSFEDMELDQLKHNLSLTPQERLLAHRKLLMKVYAKELQMEKPKVRQIHFKSSR